MNNKSIHSIVNDECKLLFESESKSESKSKSESESESYKIRTNVGKLIGTDLNSVHAKLNPPIKQVDINLWKDRIICKQSPLLNLNIVDSHNLDITETEVGYLPRTCKFYLFNCF